MFALRISELRDNGDRDCGLESELDPTVWQFVKLLSDRLDDATIPNLFGDHPRPTANLLTRMLEGHKLRSTYDFELAVAREWHLNEKLTVPMKNAVTGESNIRWNFRVLDLAAGAGTTADTVFALKDSGVFRGAKRKLHFMRIIVNPKPSKNEKLDEINELLDDIDIGGDAGKLNMNLVRRKTSVKRDGVKLNISRSSAGWHGGKKTPPKITISPEKTQGASHVGGSSTIKTPGGSSTIKPRNVSHKNQTPRQGSYRRRKTTQHSDRGQSLIFDYMSCSPKVNRGGSAKYTAVAEDLAEM